MFTAGSWWQASHRFMPTRIFIATISTLLFASAPASGRDKDGSEGVAAKPSREAREREARRACLNGDYVTGVALLSDLFLDYKSPNYIFNQGRCYEQNQRFEEAIARFREYLRTGTEDKAGAERHIAECQVLQQQKQPQPPPVPVPEPSVSQAPPIPPPAAQAQPIARVERQAPVPSGAGSRVTGIVLASVGTAAVVAGVLLNLHANSLADSIDPPSHTFNRDTESTRATYETLSWIGYGVGAAGLATGAVLYLVGSRASTGSSDVTLVPEIRPGLAAAVLTRAF